MIRTGPSSPSRRGAQSAYTITEVVVAAFVLGILTVSLLGAFSSGLAVTQMARENLRATQILTEKLEAVRLLTWTQCTNTALAPCTFTERYSPSSTGSDTAGALYQGFVSVTPAPDSIPADYRDSLRVVTVTLYWTNYPNGSTAPIVRSRQMQTCVARYGLQNYLPQ